MLETTVITSVLLFAGWFPLLYRFHRSLQKIDPVLSREIGEPSLFWTAFNGHAHLVRLMRRRDLAQGRYAPLAKQAAVLRGWALALLASMLWVMWSYAQSSPG